ncbi:hypothetical protein HanIR_Chr10g0495491 [Helianthus annuus]|nr:hypothetical protein HanIR_Chr10g0495491 [Helianthus annuus]
MNAKMRWGTSIIAALFLCISKKKEDKEEGRRKNFRVLFFMGFGLGSKGFVVLLSQEARLFM